MQRTLGLDFQERSILESRYLAQLHFYLSDRIACRRGPVSDTRTHAHTRAHARAHIKGWTALYSVGERKLI